MNSPSDAARAAVGLIEAIVRVLRQMVGSPGTRGPCNSSTRRTSVNFLNIRGSFKVGGLLDIGTQCSLVRRANGRFVFLDS